MNAQTKTILGVGAAILLVILGASLFSGDDAAAPEASTGTLSISESNWNLGNIPMSEGIVTKDVEVSNTSDQPVTITQMQTSCMCTTAQVVRADGAKSDLKGMPGHGGTPMMSETIQPGETASIRVHYDPNAHGPSATGPIRRSVQLQTNSNAQPSVQLTFSGTVTK